MVFGRELQVHRGPMVSGATGAQRANGRLSLLLVTQELKNVLENGYIYVQPVAVLVFRREAVPKTCKKAWFF